MRRPGSDLWRGHPLGEDDAAAEARAQAVQAAGADRGAGPTVTGLAGFVAVDELLARLGLVAALDEGIGPINGPGRGLTGGQLLVGMATEQLAGQDCLVGMNRVRSDPASGLLVPVPVAPRTTAGRLAGCFGPGRAAAGDGPDPRQRRRPPPGRGPAAPGAGRPAVWRAHADIPEADWRDARDMPGAHVAACGFAPHGWPAGTYTLVRRVKVPVADLSADPRSRRRRTVHKDRFALALDGDLDHVWGRQLGRHHYPRPPR